MPIDPKTCNPCAPWWLRELIYFPAPSGICEDHLLAENADHLMTEDNHHLVAENCV